MTAVSSTISDKVASSADNENKLESTYLYIQMEYCPRTLRQMFESYNHFDKELAWHLFRQIVEGLGHIHGQGIIHRDLTPNNIFFDAQNDIKIGDFGLGSEHDLAVTIEAIIDSCDDICLKSDNGTQDRTCQQFEDQGSPQYRRKKRLSEAVLSLRNSCQELDDLCYENNWTLPTYHLSPTEGGFRANITLKGVDFECSAGSDLHSIPRLARESAAAQLLAKLRSMAVQSQ